MWAAAYACLRLWVEGWGGSVPPAPPCSPARAPRDLAAFPPGASGAQRSPLRPPTPSSPPLQTVKFLKSCRLEVGMKNNVKWELNNEIVARHFLKNVSGSRRRCPEPALRRPGALCRCRELPCVSGAAGVGRGCPDPGGSASPEGFSSGVRGQRCVRGWFGAQPAHVPRAAQQRL